MNNTDSGSIHVGGLETICFLSQPEITDLVTFSKHNVFVSEKKKQSQIRQKYSFNAVYSDKSSFDMNDYLSNELLNNVFRGSSSLVISYGSTGSGKTSVIFGVENPLLPHTSLVELFLWKLFTAIEREPDTFSVGISCFELAGKFVGDLLGINPTNSTIDSLNLATVEAKNYIQARNMLSISRCRSRNWSSVGDNVQLLDHGNSVTNDLRFPNPVSNVSHEFIRIMVHDKVGHYSDGIGTTTTVLFADLVGIGGTGKSAPSQLNTFIKDLQTIATTEASIKTTNSELSELLLPSIYGSNTYLIGFVRPVLKSESRVEVIDDLSSSTLNCISSLTNKIAVGLSLPVEGNVVFLPPEVVVTADFMNNYIFGDLSVMKNKNGNNTLASNSNIYKEEGDIVDKKGITADSNMNTIEGKNRLDSHNINDITDNNDGGGLIADDREQNNWNNKNGRAVDSKYSDLEDSKQRGSYEAMTMNELSGRSSPGGVVDIKDYNKTLELLERSQAACKELEYRIEQAQAIIVHNTDNVEPQLQTVKDAIREVEKNIMPVAKHVNIPFAYGWNCLSKEANANYNFTNSIPTSASSTTSNLNVGSEPNSARSQLRGASRLGEKQSSSNIPGLTQNGFISIVDIFELYDREEKYLQDVLSAEMEEGRRLDELLKEGSVQSKQTATMKATQTQLAPLKKHIRLLLSQRQKLENDIARLEAEYRRMLLVYRWTISLDARESVGMRELERLERKLKDKRALIAKEERSLDSAKQITEQSMAELRKTVEGYRANFLSVASELNKLKASITNALSFKMGTRQENVEPQLKQALKKASETATKLFAAVKLDPGIVPELVTVCSGIGQLFDKASRFNEERRDFAEQKERLLRRNFDASRQSIEELSAIVVRISARMKDLGQFIVASSRID